MNVLIDAWGIIFREFWEKTYLVSAYNILRGFMAIFLLEMSGYIYNHCEEVRTHPPLLCIH